MAKDTFHKVLGDPPAQNSADRWLRNRREVHSALEDLRDTMQQGLEGHATAEIQPWHSSPSAEGTQIVFKRNDGYEATVLTVSIPLEGYPVTSTIRGSERDVTARSQKELTSTFESVPRDPNVYALAHLMLED